MLIVVATTHLLALTRRVRLARQNVPKLTNVVAATGLIIAPQNRIVLIELNRLAHIMLTNCATLNLTIVVLKPAVNVLTATGLNPCLTRASSGTVAVNFRALRVV